MREMEAALWTTDLGKAEEGLYSVGTPGNLGGLEAPVLSPPPGALTGWFGDWEVPGRHAGVRGRQQPPEGGAGRGGEERGGEGEGRGRAACRGSHTRPPPRAQRAETRRAEAT